MNDTVLMIAVTALKAITKWEGETLDDRVRGVFKVARSRKAAEEAFFMTGTEPDFQLRTAIATCAAHAGAAEKDSEDLRLINESVKSLNKTAATIKALMSGVDVNLPEVAAPPVALAALWHETEEES